MDILYMCDYPFQIYRELNSDSSNAFHITGFIISWPLSNSFQVYKLNQYLLDVIWNNAHESSEVTHETIIPSAKSYPSKTNEGSPMSVFLWLPHFFLSGCSLKCPSPLIVSTLLVCSRGVAAGFGSWFPSFLARILF